MLHFREPERVDPVTPEHPLPEELYGVALDHLVIACADIICVSHHQVLLVKRNRYPHSSWWIPGGRMSAGEDPRHTAIRKATQELHLAHLTPDRLQYLGTYSTCFAHRHQPPSHHGSHTLNITYCVALTEQEYKTIRIQPDEHQTWQWLDVAQAIDWLEPDRVMDQALLRILQDLQLLLPN